MCTLQLTVTIQDDSDLDHGRADKLSPPTTREVRQYNARRLHRLRKNCPVCCASRSFMSRHTWKACLTHRKFPKSCCPRKTWISHQRRLVTLTLQELSRWLNKGVAAMQVLRRGYCLCGSLRMLMAKSGYLIFLTGHLEDPMT